MTLVLETRSVSRSFGGMRAVSDVTFSVEEGEIHCIIGPNGAGKSTFFKLVIGEHEASAGRILFRGEDVTDDRPHARIRKGMSIKMQVPSIFKALTPVQNLRVAIQSVSDHDNVDDEIERLLTFLDLADQAHKAAGDMAHGHQQWLEIGMAVALKPTLLLLDEPTAGMSVEETERTGDLIKRLNRDGVTMLVVEHDMAFIRQIAHRVTVLHLGRKFAEGAMDDVASDPRVEEIYLGKSDDG